jgi:UDP-N-acetylmuramoylalanine--D-glutamate ligase
MSDTYASPVPGRDKIGIVGMGISGIAATRFLRARGFEVLACDHQPDPPARQELADDPGIQWSLGAWHGTDLARCAAVLLSPGVRRDAPELAMVLASGVPLINDVEWLYRVVVSEPVDPPARFIGITGTNGKSTVTSWVGEMFHQGGNDVPVGGNLGRPALDLYMPGTPWYVLELSSFQLESVDRFRPHIGALLNVTPDHMNRYTHLDAYHAAKMRLFARQEAGDWAVLNADDPRLAALIRHWPYASTPVPFSVERIVPGGLYMDKGQLTDDRMGEADPLISTDAVALPGWHNLANAAAAAALALTAGISRGAVVSALRTFVGLPHRMAWVRTLNGVRYFNDSKGTNVGAVIQSLRGFEREVILIAGGRDKNSDFSVLAPWVAGRCRAVVVLGEAAPDLARALAGVVPIHRVSDLAAAVLQAQRLAVSGGVVLLSPACASFDMFRNFGERGERFREIVMGLE